MAADMPPEGEHRWVDVPEGTGLTQGRPFRFCSRCDEERWPDGTILRPGWEPAPCRGKD